MIESTKGKLIEKLVSGASHHGFPPDLVRSAERRVAQIEAAQTIEDLRIPPSNHLENLSGKHQGPYSIRINQQWRVYFKWEGDDAFDVEIVDYH